MLGHPAARLAYAVVLAEDGEHGRAFDQFARAAHAGLPAAQFRLGRCYLLGLGAPSCPDAALRWLTQAAEAGEAEAQTLLASLALQGISRTEAGLLDDAARFAGRPPDYRQALRWGTPAANAGSAEAQVVLGHILSSGPEDLRDMPRAAHYYHLAADSGSAQGQFGWALALLRGDAFLGDMPHSAASQSAAFQSEASQSDASQVGGASESVASQSSAPRPSPRRCAGC